MLLTATAGTFYAPVKNNLKTTLTVNVSALSTMLPVASTAGFPAPGLISIGNEVIYYTSVGGAFTGCIRGYDGTTNVGYPAGTVVELRWVAEHHNSMSNEISRLETVLGQSVSYASDGTAYTNVDARIITFEDTQLPSSFPVPKRLGHIHLNTTSGQWYIWNGSMWNTLATTVGGAGGSFFDLNSGASPPYIYPNTTEFVDVDKGLILATATLADSLNSITGLGIIGRDSDRLSYRTPDNKIVPFVVGDKFFAPRVIGLAIDYPIVDKISGFAVIPDGDRNISEVSMVIAGDDCACTVTLNRLVPDELITNYDILTTISSNNDSLGMDSVALQTKALGTWNSSDYVINSGDVLFLKVTSISGAPKRVSVTVEAPYFVFVPSLNWEDDNVGPAYENDNIGTLYEGVA